VPARLTTAGVVPAAPCNVKVPLALPAVVPLSHTEKLAPCPTAIDMGTVIPASVNWEFEKVAC
jgi:hypothetical protein